MPVYPVSDDDHIGAALNVVRNPDPMGDAIQAKIGGLNQALTGLDLEANTPNFQTGIGGAGMPSRAVPSRPSNIQEESTVVRPTVDNPQRIAFPGVYERPDIMAAKAAARVAPEDPALKQVFGVTRDDLYQMSKGRKGTAVPDIMLGKGKTPDSVDAIMNQRNAQRLIDALAEAERYPALTKGMDAWYTMDPLYHAMVQELGPELAAIRYTQMNTRMGMMSPGSDVVSEIQRGLGADYMTEQGRFPEFSKMGGIGKNVRPSSFPPELLSMPGHPYHSTSHMGPMGKFNETGELDMSSPKVPLYIQSSNAPELGQQTRWPVPDAHFARGVGMGETRTAKDFKPSMNMAEYRPFGEWYYQNVAQPLGLEGVPAQGRQWGLMGHATGVETDIGAPKLEMLAQHIMESARRNDVDPITARNAIIRGEMYNHGGRTLGNNAIDNALRLATGGRAHFDDGGDVRGGDSVGGLRGDTGGYSGNQSAANEARMGETPGGFGGDTGRFSSHDVGPEQGAINAQTARDQAFQQSQRQAQENNAAGYALRTGDMPGGFGGDTGRYSGYTSPQQGQQDAITATLQGNIQRARQQQQQAFDKYMSQLQGPESGGQGSAYNPTTGAFGAYQLMPKTALGLMQKYAPGETYRPAEGTSNPADVAGGGLNAGPGYVGLTPQQQLRNVTLNQDLQRTLAEGLTRENMNTLASAGVPVTSGSLYTAHLLGAGDALKVLQSDPNTPLSQTGIDPRAIASNRLEGMTAGQLLARSGSQMAATPMGGVSSAGGYGRLAENVTDNSGARITDATGSPDAAVTAAKAAANAPQPSVLEKIFGSTQDQIDKLAAAGQYAGMDKAQYTAQFSPNDPNAVKERIIYENGQPKVDYYTKDLSQALFGDPLKALGAGFGNLFKPTTSDNGFRSSVTQPSESSVGPFDRAGRGQQVIDQAIAAAQPQKTAAPAPYIAQVGNYNAQLPSTTGMTAQQWAAVNTGGDMSKVNGRIKYVNGAPMLEFYSA